MLPTSSLEEIDAAIASGMREYVEAFAARLPVRRIAVVGNAPLEPSAERRSLIDSADLVVRCNSFVLDRPGEEPRLGTVTHVVVAARVTRITPWFFQDYLRRAYFVVDAGTALRKVPFPTPSWWPEDLAAWPIPNRLFGIPLRVRMRPETEGRGAVPTTGTMAAYLMRELFPEANLMLTGFSFLHDREQTEWSHQWGDTCIVHPAHKLDREGELLMSWVDDGLATYVP